MDTFAVICRELGYRENQMVLVQLFWPEILNFRFSSSELRNKNSFDMNLYDYLE